LRGGAACFDILLDGEVGVRREAVFEMARRVPGECVGEMGTLTGRARTAAVIALNRCTLLSVPMSFLEEGPVACRLYLKRSLLRTLAAPIADSQASIC